MSYRLIDSNELAEKYPEVNDMPCMYADLPNGLDGKHYDVRPVVRGKWIAGKTIGDGFLQTSRPDVYTSVNERYSKCNFSLA